MAGGFNRAEAERWLSVAEKVLSSRDFQGARSFAIRAREYDPSFEAPNQVLAVADTVIAGESIIITANGNQYHDWYAILQLPRFTQSIELIATQYRKLALLLSPERNRFPFADWSFKLVYDAWLILSNPARKIMYDTELQLSQLGERPRQAEMPPPPPPQPQHPQPVRRSPPPPARRSPPPPPPPPLLAKKTPPNKDKEGSNSAQVEEERSNLNNVIESTRETDPSQTESPSETVYEGPRFWTACPYCYVLYEYPKAYEDCMLKCQKCKRAFHAAVIASPPVTEKGSYFCCWGLYPVGYSGNVKDADRNIPKWTPISPMFACPKPGDGNSKQKKRGQDLFDEVLISDSESDPEESNDEWGSNNKKKKAKNVTGKGNESRKNVKSTPAERGKKVSQNQKETQHGNVEGMVGSLSGSGGARVLRRGGKKQMGNGLDLNVEFSNELEELVPAVQPRVNPENGMEDNIDGVFFEGLDEFLSSLPILK